MELAKKIRVKVIGTKNKGNIDAKTEKKGSHYINNRNKSNSNNKKSNSVYCASTLHPYGIEPSICGVG